MIVLIDLVKIEGICNSGFCINSKIIVFVLKSCFKYYSSDDISKDSDGMDEQCRYDAP